MFKQICTSPQAGWPCSESFQPLVTSERHPCIHWSLTGRASEKDFRLQCKVSNQKCFFIHTLISKFRLLLGARFSDTLGHCMLVGHREGSIGINFTLTFFFFFFFFEETYFHFISFHYTESSFSGMKYASSFHSVSIMVMMSWQHQELGHQQP